MTKMDFTAEEINLIAIYKDKTKIETLQKIAAALPFMDDEMQRITNSAARKLATMTAAEFTAISFTPADDTDEV